MSEEISLSEAARRAGTSPATLKRWAADGLVPLEGDRWTAASAAQARVVARMRERGHSLEELKGAADEGRLSYGLLEDLFEGGGSLVGIDDAAERTGLEPELIERLMTLLGTPIGRAQEMNEEDLAALEYMAAVLAAGFPLVAFLQLVRVWSQSLRRMADAETRLFHLYVHEPLIREGVPALEMAQEMHGLAGELLPLAEPLMQYMHNRYLRHYTSQDLIGHMEVELESGRLDRVQMTFCFVDLTGFTRYTEEAGDEEAIDLIERFTETTEATLPPDATIVKTIGDELMIVSPDPVTLTEWTVGFMTLFQERPQPRAGLHYGAAVYRDGDYFGGDVNLASRVVARALGGEVMVTESVLDAFGESEHLQFQPIGEVRLKGFPEPVSLFSVAPQS